jgi:hypothetical protein
VSVIQLSNPSAELPVQQTRIILTDDEIKALPTTSVELVPPAGVGKVWVPTLAILVPVFPDAYTGIDSGAQWIIGYGDRLSRVLEEILLSVVNSGDVLLTKFKGSTADDVENEGLRIWAEDQASDFTGGGAGNVLKITVYYVGVDL